MKLSISIFILVLLINASTCMKNNNKKKSLTKEKKSGDTVHQEPASNKAASSSQHSQPTVADELQEKFKHATLSETAANEESEHSSTSSDDEASDQQNSSYTRKITNALNATARSATKALVWSLAASSVVPPVAGMHINQDRAGHIKHHEPQTQISHENFARVYNVPPMHGSNYGIGTNAVYTPKKHRMRQHHTTTIHAMPSPYDNEENRHHSNNDGQRTNYHSRSRRTHQPPNRFEQTEQREEYDGEEVEQRERANDNRFTTPGPHHSNFYEPNKQPAAADEDGPSYPETQRSPHFTQEQYKGIGSERKNRHRHHVGFYEPDHFDNQEQRAERVNYSGMRSSEGSSHYNNQQHEQFQNNDVDEEGNWRRHRNDFYGANKYDAQRANEGDYTPKSYQQRAPPHGHRRDSYQSYANEGEYSRRHHSGGFNGPNKRDEYDGEEVAREQENGNRFTTPGPHHSNFYEPNEQPAATDEDGPSYPGTRSPNRKPHYTQQQYQGIGNDGRN